MPSIYRHTQVSYLFLVIAGPLLLLTGTIMLATRFSWPVVSAFILLVLVLVTFMTLTIVVNRDRIEVRFGPGLFRTAFPLEEICNLQVVRNSLTDGFGVHWTPTGWIFNISGMEAVEIEMRDGRLLRLGSDQPVKLATAIEDALIARKK